MKSSGISVYIHLAVCLIYIGSFYPAFWTSAIIGTASFVVHVLLLLIFTFTSALTGNLNLKPLNATFNKIYLLFILYYILRLLITFNDEYFVQIIRLTIFYLDIYITINSFKDPRLFIRKFIDWNILMVLLTTIGVILFTVGILSPIGFVNMSATYQNALMNFGLFFVRLHNGNLFLHDQFIRPSGFYDEPGSFALIIILLLIYNKLCLKSKRIEICLLIGGFVTLSMAYIFTACTYILLFYTKKKNIVPLMLIVSCLYILLSVYEKGDGGYMDYVYDKTIGRTQKMIEGEDQSRDYNSALKAFQDNLFIGETTETLDKKYPDATHETIWYFMAQNGIFGTIILFIPFIYILLSRKGLIYKKCIFIIALNLGQRPDFFGPLYLTIIYLTFFAGFDNSEEYFCK